MIKSVGFLNFKVLRNTTLPLGRFTLIVGPNGSGKSTALQAFRMILAKDSYRFQDLASATLAKTNGAAVEVGITWGPPYDRVLNVKWLPDDRSGISWSSSSNKTYTDQYLWDYLTRIRIYALEARSIIRPVGLNPKMELEPNGGSLAGVLDRLRDQAPERFEALNKELGNLLPEFDRILFDTPNPNERAFLLRTRSGGHPIPAADLSDGTVLALAILTLAHLPEPPPLIGLEEPDHGIHPRLLRRIQDALYRLSYPESFGENRPPVQVVVTTHSPYFLDLFKDHPEEIAVAEKAGLEARFQRLVDRPDIGDILANAPLGEVWYSGVLGGVPRPS